MSTHSDIPDHVPAHLVGTFNFYTSPQMTPTPFGHPQAATSCLHAGPPIFYAPGVTHNGAGAWVIVKAEDQRQILQDAETFSSRRKSFSAALGEDWPMIPLEIDPPDHVGYRTLLNPLLSPKRVAAMEPLVRQRAAELIEALKAKGSSSDVMVDFAFPFAVSIFLQFLGVPNDRLMEFVGWANDMFHGTAEKRTQASRIVIKFIDDLAELRRREPIDDFMTFAVQAKLNGRPLTDSEVRGMGILLFGAGLDTVAAAIGFDLYHLAQNPDDQKMLRADPSRIPLAVEEMLRAYSTITPIRVAIRDIDFKGIKIKKGDHISCPSMTANRDPAEFADPDAIKLDRQDNRHVAFAYGPHRCLGSHLARREIIIALEEWLMRIPAFGVKPDTTPMTFGGYVFGVDDLILDWSAR
jgi:cytochrome P450